MTRSGCVVTASLYSGRPDPEWAVEDERLATLRRLWSKLAPSKTAPPPAPPLGYRGCTLRCASGELWFAYDGVATHARADGRTEHRLDSGRRFEIALLETAPPGLLPAELPRR